MVTSTLISRDPLDIQYAETRSREDMATELYQQSKYFYRLAHDEITLLEKVTGINAAILRLKFDFSDAEKMELAQYSVEAEPEQPEVEGPPAEVREQNSAIRRQNAAIRRRNQLRADPVGRRLEQLIQSYEAANAKSWFWKKTNKTVASGL